MLNRPNKFDLYTALKTQSYLYIKGRLLKHWGFISKESDNHVIALFKSLIRALSIEIKDHSIQLTIGEQVINLKTDSEGYFEYFVPLDIIKENFTTGQLLTTVKGKSTQLDFKIKVYDYFVPTGIISDIDDTILITHVKSFFKWRMVFNSIFINPFRRRTFKAAATLYSKILQNEAGQGPIIYISNSPWNMYDYLIEFLNYNKFPKGELQLRDFGLHMLRKKAPIQQQNKYKEVEKVLKIFPETSFILIGDSAEKDYDIYTLIRQKYSSQIKRIIIRRVGNKELELKIADENAQNVLLIEDYNDPKILE